MNTLSQNSNPQERPMLNRNSIFALAAISTLAAAALAPTSASAMRGGFGGGGGGNFGHGGGAIGRIGPVGGGHNFGGGNLGHGNNFVGRIGRHPICIDRCGPHPNPPCFFHRCGPGFPPPIVWWHHHHEHPWFVEWHHPHWGVVNYETPVAVDTVATPAPCNCLTKQYLDDGSVLFKDICTKEAAMATPDELKAQAQGASPTAQ
jgi:hypothetical protein